MKKLFLLIIVLLTGGILFAQNNDSAFFKRPVNNFYLSTLGDASLVAANYERLFLLNRNFILSGKLGLGYNQQYLPCIFGGCTPYNYVTIPHHITGNLGKRKHFFEFGVGGTFIGGKTKEHYFFYPTIGYRFLPLNANKVNFRVYGQIPFTGIATEDIVFIPFGLSVGVSP